MNKASVVNGVTLQAEWWLKERLKKVVSEKHDTMEVNPFMAPLVAALHGHVGFDELADFLIGGHFSIGHATGFGKLVDEKILPKVFSTKKLDKAARKIGNLSNACFDNIDHVVTKQTEIVLLSQKASKWTIQLGQAVELNRSFCELIELRNAKEIAFSRIVVATFYGKPEHLSDKYRILRGINTGASHQVTDISSHVDILAGKSFWSWIGDDDETQKWVMEGMCNAINNKKNDLKEVVKQLKSFNSSFSKRYEKAIVNNTIDWQQFLLIVNGE